MVVIFLTAVILYSHYKRTCARISGTWIIKQTEEGIPHFRRVTIKKEMKKIYSVCIFMVLPFLIACNENHSFSLDESRQLLIVHNFLHMEIESDCLDPSESHLFFITKKNEFDTRSCDTINFKNVSSALSVEEMSSYGITKNLRRIKFRPNTRYVVIHSGMGAQVYIKEYFWADSKGKLRRTRNPK